MKFTVGWLYPDLMNIYGDRGWMMSMSFSSVVARTASRR